MGDRVTPKAKPAARAKDKGRSRPISQPTRGPDGWSADDWAKRIQDFREAYPDIDDRLLAEYLGVTAITIKRWTDGTKPRGAAAIDLVRLLMKEEINTLLNTPFGLILDKGVNILPGGLLIRAIQRERALIEFDEKIRRRDREIKEVREENRGLFSHLRKVAPEIGFDEENQRITRSLEDWEEDLQKRIEHLEKSKDV